MDFKQLTFNEYCSGKITMAQKNLSFCDDYVRINERGWRITMHIAHSHREFRERYWYSKISVAFFISRARLSVRIDSSPAGKSTRIHGASHPRAIHPDVDFAGTRGCGTARRDRSAYIRRQMRRASNFSFYAMGYVLGRRSISHVARDDKTLRAKWPVHLGPAKPAIHSAKPSRAAPREKDAKLEH